MTAIPWWRGTWIYVYDMQVKGRPQLLTDQGGDSFRPVWSPDGTRIAFSSRGEGSQDRDIHAMEMDGSAPPVRLLELEGIQSPLDWISERQMLIVHQGDPWILDLPDQGSADTAVVRPFFESEDRNPGDEYGPQGDLVTYASDATGESEIYVRTFPVSGSPVMISEGGGSEPHWSADGNSIYYFRSGSDGRELWEAAHRSGRAGGRPRS